MTAVRPLDTVCEIPRREGRARRARFRADVRAGGGGTRIRFGARFRWRKLATLLAFALAASHAGAQSVRELSTLSLEELVEVEVTSVSKRPEPLAQAAAAVYVITGDEIRRSGATNLAEALRLAPNLEVGRFNAQQYTISARGFNSANAANKLLVLIDGRSVYTPLFTSVYWDQQDLMLADVDRIEVISGPGGTLWGANAMNGVVNVITKHAADTQGGLIDATLDTFVQRGAGRWGGKLGETGSYRVYALGFGEGHTEFADGTNAHDDWSGKQAGFRSELARGDSAFTVQGDAYETTVDTPGGRRSGGNLLARWSARLANDSRIEVQAYYDQQSRSDTGVPNGMASDDVRTLDVETQYVFTVARAHEIVLGAGQRAWRDRFVNTLNAFVLDPESQSLYLTNVFVQDTIALRDDLHAIVGTKFEYSTFSGGEWMPNARLAWQASPRHFLWAAISRAVRPPSRLERDLVAPGIVEKSSEFSSEKLVAYEAGWRAQVGRSASFSVSLFYNDYTDLRTTSLGDPVSFPVHFGNGLRGHTDGVDAWTTVRLSSTWRIDGGVEFLSKHFSLKPGATDIAGSQTVLGHDPGHQFFVRSYVDLPHDTQLYVGVRQIGALADVGVPRYLEADVRLAWRMQPNLELSVAGYNLVHARHAEATVPPIYEIPRHGGVGLRWSF